MTERTAETQTGVFEVLIEGSIEDVWREITKTDELQGAVFNSRLHTDGLQPGAQIRLRTASGKYTSVVGEVTEYDPPRRYAHTMRFTNYDDPPCTVIYDLEQQGDQVRFTLTVEGMPSGTKTAGQMQQGGKMIVNALKAIVETGRPRFGTRMLYVLFKLLEPVSPKRCRTENWPL